MPARGRRRGGAPRAPRSWRSTATSGAWRWTSSARAGSRCCAVSWLAPTSSCSACTPGAIGKLGLDYARATALNPRLVYCSITAFGTRGPLAHLPGYDPLMQAYAGIMSVNGHPGQQPARVGTSIVDMGTGMWAAIGIMAGLRQRDATGRAVEVTTALFETALMWVSYHAMGYLGSGEVPQPQGSGTAMIAPYQAFPSADG